MTVSTKISKLVRCDGCDNEIETNAYSMTEARRAAAAHGWATVNPLTTPDRAPDYRNARDYCTTCAKVWAA